MRPCNVTRRFCFLKHGTARDGHRKIETRNGTENTYQLQTQHGTTRKSVEDSEHDTARNGISALHGDALITRNESHTNMYTLTHVYLYIT